MPSVVMPQPGQSVTEGTVIKWLKQVGDQVMVDEILVEIETEKVNVEVPSPFEGTLTEILAQEGDTVPVGADLAIIGEAGAPPAPDAAPRQPDAQQVQAAADAQVMTDGMQPPDSPVGETGVRVEPARQPVAADATGRNGAGSDDADSAIRYSPAVLRLAAENNLDLSQIRGTGMGGRVTRKDVVQFLERGGPTTVGAQPPAGDVATAPPAPGVATTPTGAAASGLAEERELASSFTGGPAQPVRTLSPDDAAPAAPSEAPVPVQPQRVAAQATPPASPTAGGGAEDEEIIKPSPTRLTITRNMLRVAQTVPTA